MDICPVPQILVAEIEIRVIPMSCFSIVDP
jgi:hypothetical protein